MAQVQAAVQEALLAQRAALQAETALQIQNAVQAAVAAQQQQPLAPTGYVSHHGTILPNVPFSPFANTAEGEPVVPEADRLRHVPTMTPLRPGMSKLGVEANIMASVHASMMSAVPRLRLHLMHSILSELGPELRSRIDDFLEENREPLSARLTIAQEMEWLHRYTDMCIDCICPVLTPADSLQQLQDIRQQHGEAGEQYVERALRLCKAAQRIICSEAPFSASQLPIVAENLTYICMGFKNVRVREMALSSRLLFSGHPRPTVQELKRLFCGHIYNVRAEVKMDPQLISQDGKERPGSQRGLRWTAQDVCLWEMRESRPAPSLL